MQAWSLRKSNHAAVPRRRTRCRGILRLLGRRDALLRRAGDFDAYKLGDHLGGGDAPPLRALTHLRGSPPDGSEVEILSGVLTRQRRPINEAGSRARRLRDE